MAEENPDMTHRSLPAADDSLAARRTAMRSQGCPGRRRDLSIERHTGYCFSALTDGVIINGTTFSLVVFQ
ncbi:hypothetical protein [uncultured Cedecea sp.]|uniref:hypothetical protein n=1 Tax=uncultured Cedecea sp. TaxID=988762 RepID=UPI0026052430|nr:hypothetical protein [uncultured Cedecea sp.]